MATKLKKMTPAKAAQLRGLPIPPPPPTLEEIVSAVWGTIEKEYSETPEGTFTARSLMDTAGIGEDKAQKLISKAAEDGRLERAGVLVFRGPSGTLKRAPLYRPKVKVE